MQQYCSLIYFTASSFYMFRVSTAPIIRSAKNCNAASRTGHNIGTASSLQRGQVPICTDIMTCTGGCGYSF
jgi:hypothetical protein